MANPLKNPPVYFTVAQIRFNPLLKLAEYVPSIQEAMRKAGFPDFVTRQSVGIQINMQEGQAVPTPVVQENFFFGTGDKTHCFVLGKEALTLQSTNYGSFKAFSEMFVKGLELLHELVQLSYTDRIGVRYLDQVAPKPDEKLEEYLAKEVLGMSVKLGGTPLHSFSETVVSHGPVRSVSRVLIQNGGLSFPPDMQPEGMIVTPRFLTYVGPQAMLDTDGSIETRETYSTETISAQLWAIHEVIKKCFEATATPHAFKVWDE